MIAAVIERFDIKKILFSSFNINQILSYCSQLTLLSVCVKFQIHLSAVIKQNVKLLIDDVAVS